MFMTSQPDVNYFKAGEDGGHEKIKALLFFPTLF